jgi:hypothetical protein
MPSISPASVKRPSLHERSASGQSLSSSGKQTTHIHKVHRPHLVGRHSRNVSHGKNLGKLARNDSAANITHAHTTRNHARKKSGTSTPGHSPKSPGLPKRNSSHVTLPKNHSHGNLRKNHSATLLPARTANASATNLKKQGLPPTPKAKPEHQKTGFFQLADTSSGDEEEEEWEDSTTQSPELTRNNSKASTPARGPTPSADPHDKRSAKAPAKDDTLPNGAAQDRSRSQPHLRNEAVTADEHPVQSPDLLQAVQARRGSRAPPAMSTISAIGGIQRSESSKSFQQIEHAEAASMPADTPSASVAEGSASADKAVSKFLKDPSALSQAKTLIEDPSDEDSANFMNNYKPQPSESPEKPRNMQKARFSSVPSRTQQKLELERREMLRASGAPATPPTSSLARGASTLSLHSRSGSRGRNRTFMEDAKALKANYDTGARQLNVVRRFKAPLVDSILRLKESGSLPADTGILTPGVASSLKNRPQSRRGGALAVAGPSVERNSNDASRSLDEGNPSPLQSRSSSRGRNERVQFQRQESHDDMEVTPSQGSFDGADDDDEGMSPEEALMRRIWNSRDVYDSNEVVAH